MMSTFQRNEASAAMRVRAPAECAEALALPTAKRATLVLE